MQERLISPLFELELAARSQGIVQKPTWETVDELAAQLLPRDHVPLFSSASQAAAASAGGRLNRSPSDRAELALATALLMGDLPAFPDADVDVLLEVREQLADARIRFRALMSTAAEAFVDIPPVEFEAQVDRFRRENVDEQLLNITEKLRELRAVPTLARLTRNKGTISATAALGLGAVQLSLDGILAALFSGGVIATVGEEWNARRDISRTAQQMPYWYLHEVRRRTAGE